MQERNRLIELFNKIGKDPAITCPHYKTDKTCDVCKYTINNFMCNHTERTVDYLLSNGVIVPPCKVGQTVYTRYGYSFKIQRIEVLEDKKILFRCGNDGTDDYMAFYDFEIGTEVFLTKEESEAKLKEFGK